MRLKSTAGSAQHKRKACLTKVLALTVATMGSCVITVPQAQAQSVEVPFPGENGLDPFEQQELIAIMPGIKEQIPKDLVTLQQCYVFCTNATMDIRNLKVRAAAYAACVAACLATNLIPDTGPPGV